MGHFSFTVKAICNLPVLSPTIPLLDLNLPSSISPKDVHVSTFMPVLICLFLKCSSAPHQICCTLKSNLKLDFLAEDFVSKSKYLYNSNDVTRKNKPLPTPRQKIRDWPLAKCSVETLQSKA